MILIHRVKAKDLESRFSRRTLLRRTMEAAALPLPMMVAGVPDILDASQQTPPKLSQNSPTVLSPEDDAFLEELERANFQFFWEHADPQSGLVKDRCHVRAAENGIVASIAATGFGLTALCIGQQRGYVSFQDARNRVLTTLRFLWRSMPNHRG